MKDKFPKLDLDLFHYKLDNGLNVYLVPKNNVNNIYATFTTKYGSVDTSFMKNGEKITVPNGIAHFLEHKMFESEDDIDPFTIFDQNGASSNAATSNYKTTYLFAGPNNFEENLNCLLDFVQKPYFTDNNVEKEKGIIIQEIMMCNDDIERVGYNKTLYNSFINNPIRIPVIGNVKSVNSITKDDLYKCYEAFYKPCNMFLVITGNFDHKKAIEIIKNNQKNKNHEKNNVEKIKYNEPDKVYKKKIIEYMNVSIPKLYYSIKINIKNINLPRRKIILYLSIFLDSLFGSVSNFEEEIIKEKITNDGINFFISKTDTHLLITFESETRKPSKLIKKINTCLNNNITIDDFNRKKKVMLSSQIYMSDNIFRINNKIVEDILEDGKVITDVYKMFDELKYDEFLDLLNKINYNNTCEVLIKPKKN